MTRAGVGPDVRATLLATTMGLAMLFLTAVTMVPAAAAGANLRPGDPSYDAIAKRVALPSDDSVEVATRWRRGGPEVPRQLRNVPLIGAVISWDRKYPVEDWDILVYEPSDNTLGSVATYERFLRGTEMIEPASAKGITEASPGGPRRDVWCPPKRGHPYALILDITLVDGRPALTHGNVPAESVPECAATSSRSRPR
jgi:hypothetical protein